MVVVGVLTPTIGNRYIPVLVCDGVSLVQQIGHWQHDFGVLARVKSHNPEVNVPPSP